jgi:DNA-nicking Smr family endonuclease
VQVRRLNPDENAAWGRVMATVRPLRAAVRTVMPVKPAAVVVKTPPEPPAPRPASRVPPARPPAPRIGLASVQAAAVRREPVNTLDGSWDKKLGRGAVIPDSSIDLHGHTLASAHALLDQGLDRAIRRGDRVLLLVTGKPPRPESERPHARGAIRAAVADWLGSSRHADGIAAVRGAHPRHGGQGALYIVLRRPRER